jgi:hypothetical protein
MTVPDIVTESAPITTDPHLAQIDTDNSYSAEETRSIRQRQAARSRVTGILLLGLCVLFFGITLAKIGYWG